MLRGGVFRQDEKIAKILSGWAAELIVAELTRGRSGRNSWVSCRQSTEMRRLRIKRMVAFAGRTLTYPNTSLNGAQGGTKRGWVLLLACSSMGNDEPTHKLRYSKLRESPVDDSR
jgi:hypothetical protein